MARGDFFPSLSLPLTIETQQTSENMPSPFPLNGLRYDGLAYNAPLDFSWELDLWGKIRRQIEGARADAAAAADAVHNILFGIRAEVAMNYFKLRTLHKGDLFSSHDFPFVPGFAVTEGLHQRS